MILWLDTETLSPVPIRYGTQKYASQARVIMLQWAVDDGEVHVEDLWQPGSVPSNEFFGAAVDSYIDDNGECWAHKAEFDRTVLNRHKWWRDLKIPFIQWRCTMALARMHGLPGGLDKLCEIFKLPQDQAKDRRGKELINIFCVPKSDGTFNSPATHPKEWREFLSYGGQDIVAMREVHRRCPKWNATPRMWAAWRMDQRCNERGVEVDVKFAEAAVEATTRAKRRLAKQTQDITLGLVDSTTQRDRVLQFLADTGIVLPDLKADTVERRLEDEALPEYAKELLRVRQQASKSSTAKYQRSLTHTLNGRAHDLLVFCGAQRTGRFAARTIQPQNFPRPKHEQWEIDAFIEFAKAGEADLLDPDDTMGLASSALRGLIVAADGKKLLASDYANIEGRIMAWIAGEEWKLAAFAAYDAGTGPDLYKVAYARPFNIDPNAIADKGDGRRQIGKVMELALQYYGGVGAFCAMAETYGLKLEEMAATAWAVLPEWARAKAKADFQSRRGTGRTYGLDERVWIVCQALVLMWRRAHPAIVRFWYDLQEAVSSALAGGSCATVGRVSVDRRDNWLRIRLPSGRYLCYPAPHQDVEGNLRFLGVNPYTRQWARIPTYSGKLAENIVQATAADLLLDGLVAAEERGYTPVLSVHDEAICEVPDDENFTVEGLSEIMVSSSPWTEGLPLAAAGFEAKRYRKEQ